MRPTAASVAPVLLFDDTRPGAVTAARLWWHVVSRDRYELRPLDQVQLAGLPAGPIVWVAWDGSTRTGIRALAAAGRAASARWTVVPRVAGRAARAYYRYR